MKRRFALKLAACAALVAGLALGTAAQAGETIKALNDRIGMGMQLAEAGVVQADHDQIVNDAMNKAIDNSHRVWPSPDPGTASLSALRGG